MISDDGERPLVSVVTPAYNEEAFIEETLRSVSEQDYPNVEHVVIDDGSTDATADIIRGFDSDHEVAFRSRDNKGQVPSVNEAFEMAEGDIVIWLNGDDVLFSRTVISDLVDSFDENPDVDILYGVQAILDVDSEIQNFVVPPRRFSYGRLLRRYFAIFTFMRSEIPEEYKLDEEYEYAIDYEYYLRIAADENRIGYLDRVMYGRRLHEGAKTEHSTDALESEALEIRDNYGATFGWASRALFWWDMVLDRGLRLYGLKFVFRYARNEDALSFSHGEYGLVEGAKKQLRSIMP